MVSRGSVPPPSDAPARPPPAARAGLFFCSLVALAAGSLAFALPAGAALPGYEEAVLHADPYSFHRFDETEGPTAADISGNDRDGTYFGSPTFGIPGAGGPGTDNAVGFDGSSDYMTIDAATLGPLLANVTFEVVFRTETDDQSVLFGTWNSGLTMAVNFELNRDVAGFHRFFLRNNSGHTLIGDFENSDLINGDYHHLMLTVDVSQERADRIMVYLNGEAQEVTVSSQTSTWIGDDMENLNLQDFGFPLAVGARGLRGNFDRHFEGVIDEFAIYDRTLTAADAAAHFAAITSGRALLQSSGGVGGPFEPDHAVKRLENTHATEDMSWSASIDYAGDTGLDWLRLSDTSGHLAPGAFYDLRIELSEAAGQLSFGTHLAGIVLTTTVGGETETRSEGVVLTVVPSFPIPYSQDFEAAETDASPSVLGWQPGASDNSRIVALTYAYDGTLPMPESDHSRVLRLDTGGLPLSLAVNMQPAQFPRVYLDTMVAFTPSFYLPGEEEDFKLDVFMNLEGHLVLAHGGADGVGSTLTVLSEDLEEERWYRLTILVDFDAVEGHPFFRVALDQDILGADEAGFPAPTADPAEYGGGAYFRFANGENQSPEDLLRIERIEFLGSGAMIDDFVLCADNPLTASFFVRTELVLERHALMTGGSDWMEPRGDFVTEPFAAYELEVNAGDPVSIGYTADEWHVIQSLTSQGAEVEDAAGQGEYTWSMAGVHGDVVNRIVFAPVLYDGDGQSPQWWVESLDEASLQAAESGESELTVYQGFLLNRRDLLTPFRIQIGIDADERCVLRWLSDGAPRGILRARAAGNLSTPRPDWPVQEGTVSHDAEQGMSTWRSDEPTGERGFLFIEVGED